MYKVREHYSTLQVGPFEPLKLEMSLEVLRKDGIKLSQLTVELQFNRVLDGPDTPAKESHLEVISFVLFCQILTEVLGFLLTDVKVAEQVVDGLHRHYPADLFEFGLEGGFEVEIGVGIVDESLRKQLGVALDEDVLVDKAAEDVEDVPHFFLEGFVLELFVTYDAVSVECQDVRDVVGAVAAVQDFLESELVAQLELIVVGEAALKLLALVLMELEDTSNKLNLVLQA